MTEEVCVAALDQGTSSTRVILFNKQGEPIFTHQVPIDSVLPAPGWVEEDALQIAATAQDCLRHADVWATAHHKHIECLGVANQRETTIVWDKETGNPLHNAIVWLDTRTKDTVDLLNQTSDAATRKRITEISGLPIATYFSGLKLKWLLDNVPEIQAASSAGRCMFGTVDSWLIYNLTGKKVHATDCTNASRTMLMSLTTLNWDAELCKFFGIDPTRIALPEIKSCSEEYGRIAAGLPMAGLPICGVLGDQQASLVGQLCLRPGTAKSTYGTGAFLLRNVGTVPPDCSEHGLLTTVGYKLGPKATPAYALEGSIAVAGAAVQWLRDNLGVIRENKEVDELAGQVSDTGGVCFVPAFSGLFAPYWRPDARGIIAGLTQYSTKAHIALAVLEATCFQTLDVMKAMDKDSKNSSNLTELFIDGGMTRGKLLPQLQADILGCKINRTRMPETTALGAALAAGLARGVWQLDEKEGSIQGIQKQVDVFTPKTTPASRAERQARWAKAIERSLNWV